MDADLDTLVTALYVRVDDLLICHPERAPWRPKVGITPKLADAELLTLAVLQALLGFTSESARWPATPVCGPMMCGYSWAEIASRLGITRQAAQHRWGDTSVA